MSKQSDADNRANQLNPNNEAYWSSRGHDDRPGDWQEQADEDSAKPISRHFGKSDRKK